MFVAGGTGSGKTFLAAEYLRPYNHVVVLDTKGMFSNWDNMESGKEIVTVDRLTDLPKVKTPKIIYRPIFQELTDEYYNSFFQWIYLRRNTIVLIDEAMMVTPSSGSIPEYLRGCLQRGRQLNIAIWSLTQRPKNISPLLISEATHLFIFRLNLNQDREKLVEVTGCTEFYQKPPQYTFWYLNLFRDAQRAKQGKLIVKKED